MTNSTQSNPATGNATSLYRVLTPDVAMTVGAWLLFMTGFLSLLRPSDLASSAIFRLTLVATGFALYGFGRTQKGREQAVQAGASETQLYRGLTGWLVLLGVMLGVTLVGAVLQAVSDLPVITAGKLWADYTTPGLPTYHPYWAWLLAFDWGGNLFTLAFTPVLLSLFFQRKKLFPPVMFWTFLILVGLSAARFGMASQIPHLQDDQTALPLFLAVIKAGVWIPYLRVSRRVKATFVE
jgi:hypothetical protein